MQIIGQEWRLDELLNQPLHHCNLLHGEAGSGKKLLVKYAAQKRGYRYQEIGSGVNDARQLIDDCICIAEPTMYYISGDLATIQAQNALLKLLEEPPKNAYVFIGVTDIYNVLGTIRSRAHIMHMASYSYKQLKQYCEAINVAPELIEILCNICSTPGIINQCIDLNFKEMYDYVVKVYNNILKVSTGNAFKICNNIGFKNEKGKFPVDLFLELFRNVAADNLSKDYKLHAGLIEYTSIALNDLKIRGANKSLVFDIWVLNVRKLR